MEEACPALKVAYRNMGLNINLSKTKYMAAGKVWEKSMEPKIALGNHVFETVDNLR